MGLLEDVDPEDARRLIDLTLTLMEAEGPFSVSPKWLLTSFSHNYSVNGFNTGTPVWRKSA